MGGSLARMVSMLMFIAGCSPTPTLTPSTAPTGTAIPSATATVTVTGALDWSGPVRLPLELLGGNVRGLASDGRHLVAIGGLFGILDVSLQPAIWRSDDGLAWVRVSIPVGFEDAILSAVTAGGPGFVIVGSIGKQAQPNQPAPAIRAAVWTSVDGGTWEPVVADTAFADARMADVAVGSVGLVAVGFSQTPAGQPFGSSCLDALAWTSSDGVSWSRSPASASLACSTSTSITAAGAGYVAIGSYYETDANGIVSTRPATWSSSDGRAWLATKEHDLTGVSRLHDVAAGPGGLVAIGETEEGDLGVWRSAAGQSWARVSSDAFASPSGGGFQPRGVILGWDGGFVASVAGGDNTSSRSYVWASKDGATWVRSSAAALAATWPISGLAIHGDRLVAVGGQGYNLGAWVSPPAGAAPEPAPGLPVTVEKPIEIAPDARAFDVVAGDGLLLALGRSGDSTAWLSSRSRLTRRSTRTRTARWK